MCTRGTITQEESMFYTMWSRRTARFVRSNNNFWWFLQDAAGYTVCNQIPTTASQLSPQIKLNSSSNQDYDRNPLVFIIARQQLSQDAKTFLQKSNKGRGNNVASGFWAKVFGACVGNEMLLVSDSKRAYQLAPPHSLTLSLPLPTLLFYFLSLCCSTKASGGTLGKNISLSYSSFFTLPLYSQQNKFFHLWYTAGPGSPQINSACIRER